MSLFHFQTSIILVFCSVFLLFGCKSKENKDLTAFKIIIDALIEENQSLNNNAEIILINSDLTLNHFNNKKLILDNIPENYLYLFKNLKIERFEVNEINTEKFNAKVIDNITGKRLDDDVKMYLTFSPFFKDSSRGFIVVGYTCGQLCSFSGICLFEKKNNNDWILKKILTVSFS